MIGRSLAAAMSFLLPCLLGAQAIQTISWADLGQRAKGHKVSISFKSADAVEGKAVRWDGRSLTVKDSNTRRDREILPAEVSLVRVEPGRGRAGRFAGLATGIALGTAAGIQTGRQRAGRNTATVVIGATFFGGLGALIGWGVDALRTGKPALYRIAAVP